MCKIMWCTCKVVVLLIKSIAFMTFSLPSASLDLKVPNFDLLKITHLAISMEPIPLLENLKVSSYGLLPRLWLLVA